MKVYLEKKGLKNEKESRSFETGFDIEPKMTVKEFIESHQIEGINQDKLEQYTVLINYQKKSLEYVLEPGDRITIFSPVIGG